MPLVAFLKGVNVGGHRRFRPSVLAADLADLGVINIGAAGTFVIRQRISRAELQAELQRRLPFRADIMICSGADLVRLAASDPFAGESSRPDHIRFVSVLGARSAPTLSLPLSLPPEGRWCLRLIGWQTPFLFGVHRREMEAIRQLGRLEKLVGSALTTRSWSTMETVLRVVEGGNTRAVPDATRRLTT